MRAATLRAVTAQRGGARGRGRFWKLLRRRADPESAPGRCGYVSSWRSAWRGVSGSCCGGGPIRNPCLGGAATSVRGGARGRGRFWKPRRRADPESAPGRCGWDSSRRSAWRDVSEAAAAGRSGIRAWGVRVRQFAAERVAAGVFGSCRRGGPIRNPRRGGAGGTVRGGARGATFLKLRPRRADPEAEQSGGAVGHVARGDGAARRSAWPRAFLEAAAATGRSGIRAGAVRGGQFPAERVARAFLEAAAAAGASTSGRSES